MSNETPSSATSGPRRVANSTLRSRTESSGSRHFSLGFSASRSQSPSRLTASTSSASVRLGKVDDPPFAREQKVLADADQRAERGLGRRQADAEEGQRRLGDDREREIDRGDHQHRPHHVGQDVANEDARVRRARSAAPPARNRGSSRPSSRRAPCAHIAPRTTGRSRRSSTPKPISSRLGAFQQRLRDAVEQQRDQDGGKRQLHVGDAHDDSVDPAAGVARDQPQRDADRAAERHAAAADRQRNAQAVEDRRPHVAPLVVRAEQEPRIAALDEARRIERVREKIGGRVERIGRRDPRREQRRERRRAALRRPPRRSTGDDRKLASRSMSSGAPERAWRIGVRRLGLAHLSHAPGRRVDAQAAGRRRHRADRR